MTSEIPIKTERLQKMLAAENLGGVLINAQHNFAWLTGGKSNRINGSVETGACFLFVRRDGRKFVLANNIEMTRLLAEEISDDDFDPVEFAWQQEKASGDFIFETAKSLLDDSGEIASDLSFNKNYRAIENLIAPCQYELTEPEIKRYKNLGRDAGAALEKIFESIAPGETESEIARKVKDALAADGIDSVVTLVGADARIKQFRHPVPTAKVWKKNLLIAVCVRRAGLIASLSRLACAGEISDELRHKTDAVARVFGTFLTATKPGASGAEIYEIAAQTYAEQNFADEINKHHQGGAAGYKTRAWVAHPASKEIVRNNQAFAWNPSITGTKAEETYLVGENGIENLTASPNFPQIKIEIGGKDFYAPDILQL